MPSRLKPTAAIVVAILVAVVSGVPAAATGLSDDGHDLDEVVIDRELSGVTSPFFNESGSCDDAAGVMVPASTTNSLANRALPSGHQVRGPWGDFFGRDYSDVSGSMVSWTVPMSGGKQVKVHERALPAFQRVADNLGVEAAKGRNYTARLAGSWVWRRISGRYRMSTHAFGTTIDINWDTNPYQSGGELQTDMPNWYVRAWEDAGFCWGGRWSTSKDPMHFSWKGPISTQGYGDIPEPYPPKTAQGDFSDRVFSRKADFGTASGESSYHWADGSRDGVADLYRVRSWGAGSALLEVVQAAHSFKWCSIRSQVVSGADLDAASDLEIADVDGDGRPELTLFDSKDGMVRLTSYTYESQYKETIRKTTGQVFGPGLAYLFGDHDRDGLPDLHVIERGADTKIRVYSASSGFKDRIVSHTVGKNTNSEVWQFDLGDLDSDGVPDVVMIDPRSDTTRLVIFDGGDRFGGKPKAFSTSANGDDAAAYGIIDWDGDGRPDLAMHRKNQRINVYLGDVQPGDVDFWFKTPDLSCPGSGSGIASDFNGDRRSDLLAGVPGEKVDGVHGRGAVAVVYSGSSGPDGNYMDQLWKADTADENAGSGVADFGHSVTSGDFNDDGFQDAAIGSPGDVVDGHPKAGTVVVLYGTENGLKRANSQRWSEATQGVKGQAGTGFEFGEALASGDFDGDGYDDLAVAAPGATVKGFNGAGKVHVLYGSNSGLAAKDDETWTRRGSAVKGRVGELDRLGAVLATGDFNGDGRDDLAIAAPRDDVAGHRDAGSVSVLRGTSNGLTATGSKMWTQGTPGVPGAVGDGDRFGSALASGDFDGDSVDDLAIGVPREDGAGSSNVGKVNVLYGSSAGLSVGGADLWSQNSPGLAGSSEKGDRFGAALAAGDFNSDGYSELAIGVPGENDSQGQVRIVFGSTGGLDGLGSQRWSEASGGVPGGTTPDDSFGSGLQAADFNGDGYDDLAVSIPGQDLKGASNAGKTLILLGSGTGIVSAGSNGIHQASPGVKDTPESGDRFGRLP